ncbi:hypothetical protein [Ferroacidibacillus organovorans]|uniref:Uncharacterized protein n=1 Tax=Ferroacidibacillus organovorans TaxID=1765683 RepID=A0A117SYI9_9BACL|nr:hypothetical protein [Ferroacidibacillus organovorans]KUO97038.1 hypothetical protein ATW55_11995 [Ferroacidibacillus organovorans]
MAENLYRGQAEKIGLRGANFHSQRKAFANSRYNQYKETNYKVLERDLSRRLSQSAQLAQKWRDWSHGLALVMEQDGISLMINSRGFWFPWTLDMRGLMS